MCHVLVESEVVVLVELLQGLVGVQLKPVTVPCQLQSSFAKASSQRASKHKQGNETVSAVEHL